MSEDLVLTVTKDLVEDGDLSIAAVCSVDKQTTYIDGIPIDGFTPWLRVQYCDRSGCQAGEQRFLVSEGSLRELANILSAAAYKLREARQKAEKGRDR
jgi:hypothetical protein